jgi:hypothetical protein
MNYTINTCLLKSQEFKSYPNGNLTTLGTVNYFTNKNADSNYNPIKVSNISARNENGVAFFERKEDTSIETLRAIAKGLLEIADHAEKAHARMEELNKIE